MSGKTKENLKSPQPAIFYNIFVLLFKWPYLCSTQQTRLLPPLSPAERQGTVAPTGFLSSAYISVALLLRGHKLLESRDLAFFIPLAPDLAEMRYAINDF